MLVSLTAENFQPHKKLIVKFDRHVSTIVGLNDCGKSSFLRALRLVMLNQPHGKQFIRKGRKSLKLTLQVRHDKQNKVVKRVIGKENLYELDGKPFKTMRRGTVPPEIAKILNVQEINFQKQHEAVFWFSLSPGQVARELNQLVDLESIDAVHTALSRRTRSENSKLDVCTERILSLQSTIDRLRGIDAIAADLRALETLDSRISADGLCLHQLRTLVAEGKTTKAFINAVREVTAAASPLKDAERALIEGERRIGALRRLVRDARRAETIVQHKPPDPSALNRLHKSIVLQEPRIALLDQWTRNAKQLREEVDQWNQKIEQEKELLEKETGKWCPVCGGIRTNKLLA